MFIRSGCALILFSALQVPSAPPRGGTGLVVGQVVDASSGRPVAGAIVSLSGPSAPPAQAPRLLTGKDGRFVFRDLRRGDHTITVIKPGFADGAYGRHRAGGPSTPLRLNDAERVGDVVIKLWRHAAISGTIVDESGERLVGVQVRAFRRTVVAGRRRFVSSVLGTSDDRGIYRIGGLIPGDYIVGTISRQVVVPLSSLGSQSSGTTEPRLVVEIGALTGSEPGRVAVLQSGDFGIVLGRGMVVPPPAVNGRLAVYPATFHPSTATGSAASMISLRPGEEHVNADLQLTPVPTVRVSGSLFGPEGPLSGSVLHLIPANTTELFAESDLPTVRSDQGGRFVFLSVPSGHYTLRLAPRGGFQPSERGAGLIWLDTPLSVGTEDIEGLTLTAMQGLRISGRLDFEGSSPRPSALSNIQIWIEPAERVPGTTAFFDVRPGNTGEFMSRSLPGGHYYVRIPNSPPGWMFKSATVDGRDVADIPFLLREEPANVAITFSDRWSGIRGSVQEAAGRDAGAVVVVFPSDRDAWGSSGLNPRRVRSTRTSKTGEYSFNLPAGEYYVIALSEEQSAEWQDPDFLDVASRYAARVSVVEGDRRVQDLRVRQVR